MLDAYETDHTITHLDDDSRFVPETADVDWIEAIAAEEPKPILVTADINIARKPVERQALRASGLTVVFLKSRFHQLPFHTQAVKLLTIWPELVDKVSRCREPTAFEITPAATKMRRLGPTVTLG